MQTIVNATATVKEIWSLQHPIMHKWFVFSGLSICVLFAFLLFIV